MSPHWELRRSGKRFANNGYRLILFDVFDTCLIRDFISEEALWRVVGENLKSVVPNITSGAEFARRRRVVDSDVRSRSRHEDVSITELYECLGSMYGWTDGEQARARGQEEELEASGLHRNPAVSAVVRAVGDLPVCYVTDTPHRAELIDRCLRAEGLPAGPVLCSGDLGIRKGTGRLLRAAMSRFEVPRTETLLVGNSFRVDGLGSALARVAFAPLLDANPNRYETALDSAELRQAGLLGSCLAGSGRAFRLQRDGHVAPGLLPVVAGVAGPIILASAAWALLSAEADGIDTLYFVSRDGEILLAAAEVLRREIGMAPRLECRYLYGSRRAWHLPALGLEKGEAFAAALRRMFAQSGKDTLGQLLDQLNLSDEESAAVRAEVLPDLLPDAALKGRRPRVIDALVASPLLLSLASRHAASAFQETVGYLRQEGMFSRGRIGLVDIGWLGKAAASIVAVARDQGTEVRFYFAGGLCGRDSKDAPSNSRAYLVDSRGKEVRLRSALVHLMETFCAGRGGSTIGYAKIDGLHTPIFDASTNEAAEQWGFVEYQALVRDFLDAAVETIKRTDLGISLAELEALRPVLVRNLQALWRYPSYDEAEIWGDFPFDVPSGPPVSLGRALTTRDLRSALLKPKTARRRLATGPWPEATLRRSVSWAREAHPIGLTRWASTGEWRTPVAKVLLRLGRRLLAVDDTRSPRNATLRVRRSKRSFTRKVARRARTITHRGMHRVRELTAPRSRQHDLFRAIARTGDAGHQFLTDATGAGEGSATKAMLVAIYRSRNAKILETLLWGEDMSWCEVRLWSLDEVPDELRHWTVGNGPGGKFSLLNHLIQDADDPRYLIVADDDIVINHGNLRRLVETGSQADLGLFQASQANHSLWSHWITKRVRLAKVRETTFVEIGPLFVISPEWRTKFLPFPNDIGMGWGLELAWFRVQQAGCRFGVVDDVSLVHLVPPGASYMSDSDEYERLGRLERESGTSMEDTERVVTTWWRWQRLPPWQAPNSS